MPTSKFRKYIKQLPRLNETGNMTIRVQFIKKKTNSLVENESNSINP